MLWQRRNQCGGGIWGALRGSQVSAESQNRAITAYKRTGCSNSWRDKRWRAGWSRQRTMVAEKLRENLHYFPQEASYFLQCIFGNLCVVMMTVLVVKGLPCGAVILYGDLL